MASEESLPCRTKQLAVTLLPIRLSLQSAKLLHLDPRHKPMSAPGETSANRTQTLWTSPPQDDSALKNDTHEKTEATVKEFKSLTTSFQVHVKTNSRQLVAEEEGAATPSILLPARSSGRWGHLGPARRVSLNGVMGRERFVHINCWELAAIRLQVLASL